MSFLSHSARTTTVNDDDYSNRDSTATTEANNNNNSNNDDNTNGPASMAVVVLRLARSENGESCSRKRGRPPLPLRLTHHHQRRGAVMAEGESLRVPM